MPLSCNQERKTALSMIHRASARAIKEKPALSAFHMERSDMGTNTSSPEHDPSRACSRAIKA